MIEILGEDKSDFAIYFGKKNGSRKFIGFHFPLHNGWCSTTGMERKKGWRIRGGWEYYQPAILIGRTRSKQQSKWYRFPTIYVPAKLVRLWRLRKRSWRKAMRQDTELVRKVRDERANK